MPGPRQGNRRADRDTLQAKPKAKPKTKPPQRKPKEPERKEKEEILSDEDPSGINLSKPIPLSLQQLLLDVFKTALLASAGTDADSSESQYESLDIKSLIQTIKSHLYQRDFDSAFTEAGEDHLRAYALRWSASRALGYAGLFKGVLRWMRGEGAPIKDASASDTRVVCLGGGAGAEIVALAAAWRDLDGGASSLSARAEALSLEESEDKDKDADAETDSSSKLSLSTRNLSIAAVDIADWSSVVRRLSSTLTSPDVPAPSTSRYKAPLVPVGDKVDVDFHRVDLLGLPEKELKDVVLGSGAVSPSSLLVTLMFTLNELFSTSMPKTTAFMLRLTEILKPGAVLLVVDSPGSYSTLKMGKPGPDGVQQERNYPMKFLLDHTLISVAKGQWEQIYTQDSRWWRREASRLMYDVGEGAGLEDMRFQVHIYRRI
ncbi:hypothetical protein N7520_009566 [Penicillium odoratum]|uniref:uncharacterized protein n=1 Tax=Penicillium odoratum TaxID=1167516 RepID=UPI002549BA2E|nr:uncharacterized protein N7520_009566 [Penicillium odoratum]KAJ5752649.1 hypothetical protein N7520_009566 [Penicillium odoratum]